MGEEGEKIKRITHCAILKWFQCSRKTIQNEPNDLFIRLHHRSSGEENTFAMAEQPLLRSKRKTMQTTDDDMKNFTGHPALFSSVSEYLWPMVNSKHIVVDKSVRWSVRGQNRGDGHTSINYFASPARPADSLPWTLTVVWRIQPKNPKIEYLFLRSS